MTESASPEKRRDLGVVGESDAVSRSQFFGPEAYDPPGRIAGGDIIFEGESLLKIGEGNGEDMLRSR